MDFDEYETLPTNNFSIHMIAGAIAGVMEHCFMYPFDSVKTRMQSLAPTVQYRGVFHALQTMMREEGLRRPYRGMGAVVAGAGPAHALYFSCYEYLNKAIQSRTSQPLYFVAGISGAAATLLHDGIMTPAEVVKQRLQVSNSPYKSIIECARGTYQKEGMQAFYRSYTTQLTMNVPFQIIHFMTYEFCQSMFNEEKTYNPVVHMLSGGAAGAVAAGVTTPLDVVKTLLNTQQHRVQGMVSAFKTVYRLSGTSGFFKGLPARIIYQTPSTAICWSIYELFKYLLSDKSEVKCTDKSLNPTVLVSDCEIPTKLRPGLFLVVPEVKLEPSTADHAYAYDRNDVYDYESKTWGNSIPSSIKDEPIGNARFELVQGKSRTRSERTYAEKSEWSSSIVPGSGVIGTLNFNRDEEVRSSSRNEILDIARS